MLVIFRGEMIMKNSLLEVRHVTKIFKLGGLVFGSRLTAVDNVSFTLEAEKAKIVTLAGESGSGKTTLSRIILGLLNPTAGKVLYKGLDIYKLGKRKKEFRKEVQPIFQNPFESFNPLKKVDRYLKATVKNYGIVKSEKEIDQVIDEALRIVGLNLDEVRGKYPHEFSGGQVQRIAIARALLTKPRLLVADEPVSMIDASLRMSILNIFLELKSKNNMSIIYITHDLATAYYIADDILIMYRGNIVESGSVDKVLTDPLHPYTKLLLDCIPEADPKKRWTSEIKLSGMEIKEFEALGCKFANRCPHARDICFKKRPPDIKVGDRMVKCWLFADNLT